MKTHITYGQLQRLLGELKFVDRPAKPHRKVFEHPDFINGTYDTGFVERTFL